MTIRIGGTHRPGGGRLRIACTRGRASDGPIVLLTLLFVLVATGWALAVPLFHAPDEPMHVDLINALADRPAYPAYDERYLDRRLSSFSWSYLQSGGGAHEPRLGNVAQPPGADSMRPVPGGAGPSSQVDQMPQHPPLYYEALAVGLRGIRVLPLQRGRPTIAAEVLLLRLVNILIVAPLPWLTWRIAREAGAADHVALSGAALLLAVPQLGHIVGSVNNDNLLIVLGAALTLVVLQVVRRPLARRTDVILGLLLGAALLTKAFAFVLVPWVVLAYALAARRQGSPARAAVGLTIAGSAAMVTAGWFWLRNLVRYGQIAPTTFFEQAPTRPRGQPVDQLAWVHEFVRLLPERFWGSIGRYAARLPLPVVAVASLVVIACITAAVVGRDPAAERDRTALVMAALPAVLLAGYVAQHAHHIYVVSGWYSFIQGRYLFAGIGGLMAVAAAGADRLCRGRLRPIHALGCALAMQAIAAWVVLRDIWGGAAVSPSASVTTMVVWSPLPGPLVVLVGVVTGLTIVATARAVAPVADVV